jgi:hypothetical protein
MLCSERLLLARIKREPRDGYLCASGRVLEVPNLSPSMNVRFPPKGVVRAEGRSANYECPLTTQSGRSQNCAGQLDDKFCDWKIVQGFA